MKVNSLKGTVNLVHKLQAKIPELTPKNAERASLLLDDLIKVLKAEAMAIFGDTFTK